MCIKGNNIVGEYEMVEILSVRICTKQHAFISYTIEELSTG